MAAVQRRRPREVGTIWLDRESALRRVAGDYRGMSITADGWFTWMIRDPCPINPEKVNGGVNGLKMMIPHSAEGYWPYLQELAHFGPDSWGASNLKDGRCYQHYSIYQQTQTSGAGYPNNNAWTNETEGVAGEPLTDKQVANIVRQINELSALKGWTPSRPKTGLDKTATLYEHNECTRWGAKYTACPSGRIPWPRIMAALNEEEDEMKPIRVWCAERGKTYLLGPFGAVPINNAADDKALEKLYGAHAAVLTGATLDALVPK